MTKTSLINRAKVKQLAMACVENRARKFSRVGDDFYVAANACLSNFIVNRVANHPSVGVTLK